MDIDPMPTHIASPPTLGAGPFDCQRPRTRPSVRPERSGTACHPTQSKDGPLETGPFFGRMGIKTSNNRKTPTLDVLLCTNPPPC